MNEWYNQWIDQWVWAIFYNIQQVVAKLKNVFLLTLPLGGLISLFIVLLVLTKYISELKTGIINFWCECTVTTLF